MIRKSLIALAVIALFACSVHADPSWGVTTAMNWEWAKKAGPTIPVYMKIVRWADIYYEGNGILLVQNPNTGNFVGCTMLNVCNNFPRLMVEAEVIPNELMVVERWDVSLEYAGTVAQPLAPARNWEENKTSELVEPVHLATNLGLLQLCVRAVGVDPQSQEFNPENPSENIKEVATVELTMYPNDAPTAADAALTNIGTVPGQADDLGAPLWNEIDGGGGGIPGGTI